MKVFVLSQKVGSKIIDFLVLVMTDVAALHLDRSVHIVKRKITLTPAKSKLSAFQERFYLRASLCKIIISSFAHKMDFAHDFSVDFF